VRHGDLLHALALPAAAALEHAKVVAARPTPGGVDVELEGASAPRHFDFVIGADGVNSAMRLAVADDGLRPSSMTGTGWRFIADNPGIACWTACSGRDVTFLLIPVEEARVYGYAARTRGGTTGTDRSWLALMAKGFLDPLGTAVAQALAGGELHHGPVDEVCGWSDGTTRGSCSSVMPRMRPDQYGRRAWRWPSRTRLSSASCWH